MSGNLLKTVGLNKEQVLAMTWKMRRMTRPITHFERKDSPRPAKAETQQLRDALERYLRKRKGEWLDSNQLAAGVGCEGRLAANILTAMVRGGLCIEKRISPDRRAEYRWNGGAA